MRDDGKEVDNYSILNERLSRFEDVEQTRKQRRRERQKKAQQEHEVKTNKSKVVELFPENDAPEEVTILQESLINTAFDANSQNIVNSKDQQVPQNKPDTSQTSKVRRPRVSVKDWNQFMKDNW
ncbi:hypothetical protein [Nostoc piscinale]|uniref:hypothetical protein n=1 Tax=Nostoc piscinale TaxID=224012 RepID=UPI000784E90F|nr:hypothetical protein [Nostoc piscinale]